MVGDRLESSSEVAMEGESLEGECPDERPRKAGGRYIPPPNSPLACIWLRLGGPITQLDKKRRRKISYPLVAKAEGAGGGVFPLPLGLILE